MASNGKGGQGQVDDSILFIGIALFVAFLIFIVPKYQWVFFEYWRYTKIAQFSILSWINLDFFNGMNTIKNQLLNMGSIKAQFVGLSDSQASQLNSQFWDYILIVDRTYTKYFSFVIGIFMFYLGVRVVKETSPVTKNYNFETFLQGFSKVKPLYNDIIDKKNRPDYLTLEEAIKKGTISMKPFDFATSIPAPGTVSEKPIYNEREDTFDEELAKEALDAQLGNLWRGEEQMTEPQKYVFKFLSNIVKKKTKMDPLDIMNKHAFVITGLRSLYEEAKDTGKVPSALFRSEIKYKDTYLWRMMSDTGRSPMVMSSGIHAHHLLEKSLGTPVNKPSTEAAVYGLAETIGFNTDRLSFAETYNVNKEQ